MSDEHRRQEITDGRATLGIELGSTRIKAVLLDGDLQTLASGGHEWENEFVDGRWTYSLDSIHSGLRAAYADLVADVEAQYGVRPERYRAVGVSAMMHGYLAFDADGALLVPFRTWRNTSTGPASAALSAALDFAVPLRWSIAHLYQAVLDGEEHVGRIARVTTLAGYVHELLTGRDVLGVGDASGVFPIDPATRDYDRAMLATTQAMVTEHAPALDVRSVLPDVLVAGQEAGRLTDEGASRLDPSGTLRAGIPFCPPEGDAGTGMVATNAVAPRTGNASVGTSIFAMVVLEHPLAAVHAELDIVTTPAGDAVAMVHCNNGASELAAWAKVFGRFAEAAGSPMDADAVYATMLAEALASDTDAGGLLASNYLSGEPVTGVEDGRPLLVRPPSSRFTFGNLVRAEVYAAFATLSIGMDVLADEHVAVDQLFAHGGLFRTPGAAQQLLAAALGVPVAVGSTAGEGGAWGAAVLAAYLDAAGEHSLTEYLATRVFGDADVSVVQPAADDLAGFAEYLDRYRRALPLQAAAAAATPAAAPAAAATPAAAAAATPAATPAGPDSTRPQETVTE